MGGNEKDIICYNMQLRNTNNCFRFTVIIIVMIMMRIIFMLNNSINNLINTQIMKNKVLYCYSFNPSDQIISDCWVDRLTVHYSGSTLLIIWDGRYIILYFYWIFTPKCDGNYVLRCVKFVQPGLSFGNSVF